MEKQQPLDKTLMYVDFDKETNDWCVFDDNGFAHSNWSSKASAETWLDNFLTL